MREPVAERIPIDVYLYYAFSETNGKGEQHIYFDSHFFFLYGYGLTFRQCRPCPGNRKINTYATEQEQSGPSSSYFNHTGTKRGNY
jgi:hypothetical protein